MQIGFSYLRNSAYTLNSCFRLVLCHKNNLKHLTLPSLLLILANGQKVSEEVHGLLEKRLLSVEEKGEDLGQIFFPLQSLTLSSSSDFFYMLVLSFPPPAVYKKLRELWKPVTRPKPRTAACRHIKASLRS